MPYETFLGTLKVKIVWVKQRSKWSLIELVQAITGIFMHGYQNKFAQLLSTRRKGAVRNIFYVS